MTSPALADDPTVADMLTGLSADWEFSAPRVRIKNKIKFFNEYSSVLRREK